MYEILRIFNNYNALYYTFYYIIFVFYCLFPSYALDSLGMSVQMLLAPLFKNEPDFIKMHKKRCCLNILVHYNLLTGYIIYMYLIFGDTFINYIKYSLPFGLILSLKGLLKIYLNFYSEYNMIDLILSDFDYGNVRNIRKNKKMINNELKKQSENLLFPGSHSYNCVIITDHFFIKTDTYNIYIIPTFLSLISIKSTFLYDHYPSQFTPTFLATYNLAYINHSDSPIQILNFNVKFDISKIDNIFLHFNSNDISNYCFTFSAPVHCLSDIEIKTNNQVIIECLNTIVLPIDQQFLNYFEECANTNTANYHNKQADSVSSPEESDSYLLQETKQCIICISKKATAKIIKQCKSKDCKICKCNPVMCIKCLGRWFIDHQLGKPEQEWADGKCSCPTCRAKFCIRDIVIV